MVRLFLLCLSRVGVAAASGLTAAGIAALQASGDVDSVVLDIPAHYSSNAGARSKSSEPTTRRADAVLESDGSHLRHLSATNPKSASVYNLQWGFRENIGVNVEKVSSGWLRRL